MTWNGDADTDVDWRFVSKGALLSKIIKKELLAFFYNSQSKLHCQFLIIAGIVPV